MVVSLSESQKDIDASLNSLEVIKQMNYISSQTKKIEAFLQQKNNIQNEIEKEIKTLLSRISLLETKFHEHSITSYDSLIAECREVLNSFDPDGQITDTDTTLF